MNGENWRLNGLVKRTGSNIGKMHEQKGHDGFRELCPEKR